jgi:hypothetical protein
MKDFIEGFKQFMNKYGNTIWWCWIFFFFSYTIWTIYQDPSKAWSDFQMNIVKPWYYIPIGLVIFLRAGVSFFLIDNFAHKKKNKQLDNFAHKKKNKQLDDFIEEMKKSVIKSAEETRLMRENKTPSDEDIDKYYKMYLVKFELDNKNQWNTEKPMSFDHWEKCAKNDFEEEQFGRVGWQFMIAKTSDAFMFDPTSGQSTMMRYNNYEDMLERDEYKDLINRQLDIE